MSNPGEGGTGQPEGAYSLDRPRSEVTFGVRLLGWKVVGRFPEFDATIALDEGRPGALSVDFTIPVARIDTGVSARDEHLRSPDFFDAARFPTIRFVGRSEAGPGGKPSRLTGDLTIRDVTRPATFEVRDFAQGRDPSGKPRISFEATSRVHRQDFGVGGRSLLERGGLLVGSDVDLVARVVALRGE